MNYLKSALVVSVTLVLTSLVSIAPAVAQGQSTALERGYRTGYSDGYNAGFRDGSDKAERDYRSKDEYQRADRSYNEVWGPVEDYRDGYQQGFEVGYGAGYDHQQFNSSVPTGLRRRSLSDAGTNPSVAKPNAAGVPDSVEAAAVASGTLSIPRNTMLTVELLTPLSTDVTQLGDRFRARVTEPAEYAGTIVEGRVTQVKRPGKVKGVAELQLTFEQIRLADGRSASFRAQLVEIVPTGRNEGTVDSEGGVRGRDSTKDDVAKVGAATGVGAIIGAIAGGGKGAAIGAGAGGAVGTTGVMLQRGKDVRLETGQQLKIRTSADTSVL